MTAFNETCAIFLKRLLIYLDQATLKQNIFVKVKGRTIWQFYLFETVSNLPLAIQKWIIVMLLIKMLLQNFSFVFKSKNCFFEAIFHIKPAQNLVVANQSAFNLFYLNSKQMQNFSLSHIIFSPPPSKKSAVLKPF